MLDAPRDLRAAFMAILGSHDLPFGFLYGMRVFAALALLPVAATVGAWLTTAALYAFGFARRTAVLAEGRG